MLKSEIEAIVEKYHANPRQATDFELVFVLLMRLFGVDSIRASDDKSQIEARVFFTPQGKIKTKGKHISSEILSELLAHLSFQVFSKKAP